jgi:two-component system, cell cycle response regulator
MAHNPDNRVMLVDDSSVDRRLISGYLRDWGFDVIVANDGLEAWNVLGRPGAPSLAVLDWVMPRMDGVELCRRLREQGASESYVYTILLTAKDEKSDWHKAMEAGVDDYLVKPFDPMQLKARLLVGKRIVGLQQDLIAARDAMRAAATFDGLTGLLNRSEIVDFLSRELSRSWRVHQPVSVILADIDHFKAVNDRLGHLVGDEVLKEVARRLRAGLRPYDRVGRFGGEEFLIVMPACDLVPAFTRADQIRGLISGQPMLTNGGSTTVTLSMGITAVTGTKQADVQAVLRQADLGLYQAKRKGRNRVEQVEEAEIAVPIVPH